MPGETGRASGDLSLVRWAPRVNPAKIRRLYESDAARLLDEELLEELALALYARSQSILAVTAAHEGRVSCPRDGTMIHHHWLPGEVLACPTCGWSVPWHDYWRTYEGRHLHGGGALDALRQYVRAYEAPATARQRLLAIDALIHAFHWELVQDPGRSVARNLIYARNTAELLAFLDDLAYGDAGTPELRASKARWDRQLERSAWRRRGGLPHDDPPHEGE